MFILRTFIYLILITLLAQVVALEGFQDLSSASYSERSLTEYLQSGLLFISFIVFLYSASIAKELKIAAKLIAALMAMMFVRESDAVLDTYVFDGAWQTIVLFIIVSTLFSLRGQFGQIYPSLKQYASQSSFGTFLAGMVVVLAFSRMMGRGSFWKAVMGDGYMRVVKNIVEEGIETLGYSLITIAAVEFFVFCKAKYKATEISKKKIQRKSSHQIPV
ncbi:MAG: hypothetical protein ABJE79_01915 [Marinomonas sp.]